MKKTFILRKPGFARNEIAMTANIETARTLFNKMSDPNVNWEERYNMMNAVSECLDKAAEAGGFFNTKDLLRWIDSEKDHT